jgi:hypothetical protein
MPFRAMQLCDAIDSTLSLDSELSYNYITQISSETFIGLNSLGYLYFRF